MGVVDVVRSDLAWLVEHFEWGTRSRDDLRHASGVLRRLTVDATLQQARKAAGATGQPALEFYDLSQVVDLSDLQGIEVAAACGCRIERRVMGPFKTGPSEAATKVERSTVASLPLQKYLKSPCLVVRETSVSRAQVVKYVANKLGGVHFDPSRSRKGDEYMLRLEEADQRFVLKPLTLVDVSLLAIAQALISAPTVMEPFGLRPIDLTLNVPLETQHGSIEIPRGARLKLDLMGDESSEF